MGRTPKYASRMPLLTSLRMTTEQHNRVEHFALTQSLSVGDAIRLAIDNHEGLRARWDKAIDYARSLPMNGEVQGWQVLDALVDIEQGRR